MPERFYSKTTPQPELPSMGTMESDHYAVEMASMVDKDKEMPLKTSPETLELTEAITKQNKDAGVTTVRKGEDYASAMLEDLPQDWKNGPEVKHA